MILAHLMYGAALAVLDRKIVLKRGWPGSTSTWPSQ
jgi:hypothetical protein